MTKRFTESSLGSLHFPVRLSSRKNGRLQNFSHYFPSLSRELNYSYNGEEFGFCWEAFSARYKKEDLADCCKAFILKYLLVLRNDKTLYTKNDKRF